MATLVGFGAWTSVFATRLAAGEPTPGLGIVERIDVYSGLLWIALLSVALLRIAQRPNNAADRSRSAIPDSRFPIPDGYSAPGFEEVRTEFARNFAERGEIGAAVAGSRRRHSRRSPHRRVRRIPPMWCWACRRISCWVFYVRGPRYRSARASAHSERRAPAIRSRSPIPTRGSATRM
jgi:hypothetical protein